MSRLLSIGKLTNLTFVPVLLCHVKTLYKYKWVGTPNAAKHYQALLTRKPGASNTCITFSKPQHLLEVALNPLHATQPAFYSSRELLPTRGLGSVFINLYPPPCLRGSYPPPRTPPPYWPCHNRKRRHVDSSAIQRATAFMFHVKWTLINWMNVRWARAGSWNASN